MRRSKYVLSLLFALAAGGAQAVELAAVNGAVRVERDQQAVAGERGTALRTRDVIVVPAGAEAVIRFDDGGRLAVRPGSRLQLKQLADPAPGGTRQEVLSLVQGGLRYLSSALVTKNEVSFETISASIGIRGTDVEIALAEGGVGATPPGTYLKVNTGAAVLAAADGSTVAVEPGQVAFGAQDVPGRTRSLRPLGRRVEAAPTDLFRAGALDSELR